MAPLIQQRLTDIQSLCEQYGAQRMFVFGSAARDGDFGADSDVDLLYRLRADSERSFDEARMAVRLELRRRLEAVLGRAIDLVEIPSVTNPSFIQVVNREKVKIYEA